GESVSLDREALRERWRSVCTVLQQVQPDNAADRLAAAVRDDHLSPEELLAALLAGRAEEIPARADALDLDAGLVMTVLRFTVFPLLVETQTALTALCPTAGWPHGTCPICGSGPLLGEFRGLEQTRWLRCGWCAAAWEFPRLQCPFCGERDHRQLGYLHVEGEETQHRAATCETCRGYVKMV